MKSARFVNWDIFIYYWALITVDLEQFTKDITLIGHLEMFLLEQKMLEAMEENQRRSCGWYTVAWDTLAKRYVRRARRPARLQ